MGLEAVSPATHARLGYRYGRWGKVVPPFRVIAVFPLVSSVPSAANVATGFCCSWANRNAYIAPPVAGACPIKAPCDSPMIVLLRLLSVSAEALVPKGNSLYQDRAGIVEELSQSGLFSGGKGRSNPQGMTQAVAPLASRAAR